MCGIFGVCRRKPPYNVAYTTPEKEYTEIIKKAFNKLMIRSIKRGEDSSGLFAIQNNNINEDSHFKDVIVTVFKDKIPSTELVSTEKYKSILSKVDQHTGYLVGHTRAATSGSAKFNKNNHPFVCGRVIGVHNGVIYNWKELADKFNISLRGECDSEIIFALINAFLEGGASIKESIQKAAAELNGWMACAVVDIKKPSEMILFRRDAPLSVKSIRSNNIILFASDELYIHSALCEDISGSFRVYDAMTGILENGTAIKIKNFGDYDWLQKVETFPLTPKTA